MYRVDRNNFYERQKPATIYTPAGVSGFIYRLVAEKIDRTRPVLDPCVGRGSLLMPFIGGGFKALGVDICHQGFPATEVKNYLAARAGDLPAPSLVIMNPPFNIDRTTRAYVKKHYGGRPLLPEIWLQKAIELFGREVPMVLFAPYGMRLNLTQRSRRWRRFCDGDYPDIASIISLPKDIFDGILFHSEILIFNIKNLKPHYFYSAAPH